MPGGRPGTHVVAVDLQEARREAMRSGLTVTLHRRGWGDGPVDWHASVVQVPLEAVGPTKAAALGALAEAIELYEEVV